MKSILETAREDSRLSTSIRMIEASGLSEALRKEGELTAFIPTNEAFSAFPGEVLDAIAEDRGKLAGMIGYHVVRGKLTAHELARMEAIRTLQGDHLDITWPPMAVRLNDATVIVSDVRCTNGIYHIIDRVLLPRAVEARVKKTI